MSTRTLMTFDYALKNVLREKANFEILEGFLSALLSDDIHIQDILESESNQARENEKFNRVDVLAKDKNGQLILVEVQYDRELDYFQRIMYGVSKLAVEHIKKGDKYKEIKRVISVHIVHFDLGIGEDYLYVGTTNFVGVHTKDVLGLNEKQKAMFKVQEVNQLFPQIYVIRVDNYHDEVESSVDEWIYFLKNSEVKDSFKSKNIEIAKEKLSVLTMTEEEQRKYNAYLEDLMYQKSMFWSARVDGLYDGRKEGREEGRAEGKRETARKMLAMNLPIEVVEKATEISAAELQKLKDKQPQSEHEA
ncbi:MAG: Rpn family recombination-promoting nuclease/putative transposase [Thermoguttaceae bacterium]